MYLLFCLGFAVQQRSKPQHLAWVSPFTDLSNGLNVIVLLTWIRLIKWLHVFFPHVFIFIITEQTYKVVVCATSCYSLVNMNQTYKMIDFIFHVLVLLTKIRAINGCIFVFHDLVPF